MKKLALIVLLLFAALFAGCGNNNNASGDDIYETRSHNAMISTATWRTVAVLEDGTLWEWGLSPVKVMDNVIFAVTGDVHSLAITADNALWAWGDNA